MKFKKSSLYAVACSALAVYSAGISAQPVRVEGSGAGLTISQAAATEFYRSHGVTVNVGLTGSVGAFAKLCRGEADLIHSARPILKSEIEACQESGALFIELPLAFDAVTVVVNLKDSFVQSLTFAELRTMWQEAAQGKVVRWNQVNTRFPDAPLKLLAPDRQFEALDYFASALLGPGKSTRRDYMGSVDDNVLIQGVKRDVNTVSYLPVAAYLQNRARLRAVPIASSAAADAVTPTPETIANGQYQFSRPLFLYVNLASLARPEVAAFADFYSANASRFAGDAQYVPLTDSTYSAGRERLRRRVAGSVWNGAAPVGLSLQELQKRAAL